MPFRVLTLVPDVIIRVKFYFDPLTGFWEGAPPKVPFPILFGMTLTTVLHYCADCDRGLVNRTHSIWWGCRICLSLLHTASTLNIIIPVLWGILWWGHYCTKLPSPTVFDNIFLVFDRCGFCHPYIPQAVSPTYGEIKILVLVHPCATWRPTLWVGGKAILRVLGAYDDVALSILSLAIFPLFVTPLMFSSGCRFNGDGGQHPIWDMWPKSKTADTNLVAKKPGCITPRWKVVETFILVWFLMFSGSKSSIVIKQKWSNNDFMLVDFCNPENIENNTKIMLLSLSREVMQLVSLAPCFLYCLSLLLEGHNAYIVDCQSLVQRWYSGSDPTSR